MKIGTHVLFQGTGYDAGRSYLKGPICPRTDPHLPHRVGAYRTVRYGDLDQYCRGVAGDPPLFRIVQSAGGDAQSPSYLEFEVLREA